MKEIKVPQEEKELIKHTAAIHCSNALSLLQRKISNVLLFHAYQHLLDQEEHKISIKELCHYLHYKGNNYDVIKQALKALISTVIEWNLTDDKTGEEDWTASSILASVNIYQAVCTYAYSPRMRRLLFSPSMYGKINLIVQSQFTSSYGLALYENCIRYRGLDSTKDFSLEMFRRIMGVPEGTYVVFRDLKRRVLDKAVDEVNTLTDLLVEPEIKRVGRKVVNIRFRIQSRHKKKRFFVHRTLTQSPEVSLLNDQPQSLVVKLNQDYGLDEMTSLHLLRQYGDAKLEEVMAQIESSKQFLEGKIENCGGYLISFLANDYAVVASAGLVKAKKDEKEQIAIEADRKERASQNLRAQYTHYKNELICDVFRGLGEQKQGSITEAFFEYLRLENNEIILSMARKRPLTEGINRPIFCQFMQANYPDLIPDIPSLEEYRQANH